MNVMLTERPERPHRPDRTVIRPARREDCGAIAELFLIASDGLAAYIWSRLAGEGESLTEVGRRRYAREGVDFSYENCLLAERDGALLGMLHSFPMPHRDDVAARAEESDPVLRPAVELEDPGSLYIAGLAVYGQHRSRGLGTRLLESAHDRARTLGLPRVSLLCFERNAGAMRLYQSFGYEELDRRPILPHPSLHYRDGDIVLLARPVE